MNNAAFAAAILVVFLSAAPARAQVSSATGEAGNGGKCYFGQCPDVLPKHSEPPPSIEGTWRDTNDRNNVTRVTQQGDQFDFTRTGTLPNGTWYQSSGSGQVSDNTFTSHYSATYQNRVTSTGICNGKLPREGILTEKCSDRYLGEFSVDAKRD